MKTSESIKTISAALLDAQKAIGFAAKGAVNPFFKSKYADLGSVIEAVKGPLNTYGITFLQAIAVMENGNPCVETTLLHTGGEFIATITPVYCKEPNNPQAFGSGVTYTKRYALQAFLGIPTEDDDGNRGAKPKAVKKEAATKANITSEAGSAFLETFSGAEEALAEMRESKIIPQDVEDYVQNFYIRRAQNGQN